jgi:3-methyl-2-oxobutanoate hydroxymethyltransferase
MPFLTCYDYTTARHMHAAGVPGVLVGDSAANVVLGHTSTLPITLPFLIDLTAAVRRGHPDAFLVADMPFGSYHASEYQAMRNLIKMAQQSNCDAIKVEVTHSQLSLIRIATDAGIAVVPHLGLRPQSVQVLGGYRTQAKTPEAVGELVELAKACEQSGAVALLLEAIPSTSAAKVAEAVKIPLIGCGAGPACHGHVIVTPDYLGLTGSKPKFVPPPPPAAGGVSFAEGMRQAFAAWVESVKTRKYPGAEHEYGG